MMKKILITGFVLISATTLIQSQTFNANDENYGTDYFIENEPAAAKSITFVSTIESILQNPDVKKNELAPNHIQAIGMHKEAEPHFIIHIKNDKLHGDWQSFYTNNQLCDSGRIEKNIPDGEWKTWYPNGQLKSIRTYNAEKYHFIKADIRLSHPRYQRYQLTHHAQSGRTIAHHFLPKFHRAKTDVQNITLLDKIKHNTESDGSSYIAPFDNCVHHGMFIDYFENGAVKDSGHYVNGLKHGLWEETAEDGNTLAFGLYNHGVKNSQWKYYDKNGKLLYTEYYKRNGKKKIHHHFR